MSLSALLVHRMACSSKSPSNRIYMQHMSHTCSFYTFEGSSAAR